MTNPLLLKPRAWCIGRLYSIALQEVRLQTNDMSFAVIVSRHGTTFRLRHIKKQ
ncbi:hypothetical protein CSX04_07558 [Burkholderia cepacia]|nr:hypothetical protein CSX04_07558 [Burkholderia cepacia]